MRFDFAITKIACLHNQPIRASIPLFIYCLAGHGNKSASAAVMLGLGSRL